MSFNSHFTDYTELNSPTQSYATGKSTEALSRKYFCPQG